MRELLPQHQQLIDASAISPEVAAVRGYHSAAKKAQLADLGFPRSQQIVPTLVIPVNDVRGEIAAYQHRPDTPRAGRNGKPIKYESKARSRMVVDVPPAARPQLGDPSTPLFITEGVRKADAGVSQGFCCIALLGVWNFRGTNEHGGKTALADWESIALNGRKVYVVFDSDVMEKAAVYKALERLKAFLEARGATVLLIYLPPGADGAKVGLDDFFADGGTVETLLSHAAEELRVPPGAAEDSSTGPYRETDSGIVWLKEVRAGEDVVQIPTQLTNFTARIISDQRLDDGVEVQRSFEIEAAIAGKTPCRFSVPAYRFSGMNWPTEHLGAQAIVYPGLAVKDHTRASIQFLSTEVAERTVYTHTGWRLFDGVDVFLHAGGGIGAKGVVPGLEVQLSGALASIHLPPPGDPQDLRVAVRESLNLLTVGPDRITVPVLAAAYCAPILEVDFGVHVAGHTGAGKTELAALAQQHFGAAMDARHLPGSWSSTGNALEGLASAAKDIPLVVDDFAPTGSTHHVAALHREADRVFRAQGNRLGRQRMRADGTLREARPPRGLILSTGEDVPRGKSLQARLVVVEVEPEDLKWDRMTTCQEEARAGVYAAAMSGFIQWLAPRRNEDRCPACPVRPVPVGGEGSDIPGDATHKRAAANLQRLLNGFLVVLDFALEVGAIDQAERHDFEARAQKAFAQLAATQQRGQDHEDPALRFLELLAAAISSGRAHIAGMDGNSPTEPLNWGWRNVERRQFSAPTWEGKGDRVGWVDEDAALLYLDPVSAFAASQRMGREGGDAIPVSLRTLQRRLREKAFLAQHDDGRTTVKVELQSQRRRVLCVAPTVLTSPSIHSSGANGAAGEKEDVSPEKKEPSAKAQSLKSAPLIESAATNGAAIGAASGSGASESSVDTSCSTRAHSLPPRDRGVI